MNQHSLYQEVRSHLAYLRLTAMAEALPRNWSVPTGARGNGAARAGPDHAFFDARLARTSSVERRVLRAIAARARAHQSNPSWSS